MANYQQNQQFGKFFGYGTSTSSQYDSSSTQNKWGTAANTVNQTQTQSQYQAAPQSYGNTATGTATGTASATGSGSGFGGYGNVYGQQQSYTGMASSDSSFGTSTFTGNKTTGGFNGNAAGTSTAQATGFGSMNTVMNSYQTSFVPAGFNNNTTANQDRNSNASNQMSALGYGSTTPNMFGSNQDTSAITCMVNSNVTNTFTNNMSNNTNNAAMATTTQVQTFGNTTSDTMNQFNQMPQMFGNGSTFGTGNGSTFGTGNGSTFGTSGDSTSTATGGNYSTDFNEGFNTGMMTLLQQSLLQQTNNESTSGYGNFNTNSNTATGSAWGTSDGSGGYYAPPMDNSTSTGNTTTVGRGFGAKQWNSYKGNKWSGKDNKQDFYGKRFSKMQYTGVPGAWNQGQNQGHSHTGSGRGKNLLDGIKVNANGEKVISVEIPVQLLSRWGQLRKIFSKQDTEVAKHLMEFHDQKCEECIPRDQEHDKKKKKQQPEETEKAEKGGEVEPKVEELTEEDLMLQQIMGFGNFNTPKDSMTKNKNGGACIPDSSSTAKSWERAAGFIGPKKTEEPSVSDSEAQSQGATGALSKEEKLAMAKLGWSVFNSKKYDKGGENDDDEDDDNDDNDDDEGNMDDGDKGAAAAQDA